MSLLLSAEASCLFKSSSVAISWTIFFRPISLLQEKHNPVIVRFWTVLGLSILKASPERTALFSPKALQGTRGPIASPETNSHEAYFWKFCEGLENHTYPQLEIMVINTSLSHMLLHHQHLACKVLMWALCHPQWIVLSFAHWYINHLKAYDKPRSIARIWGIFADRPGQHANDINELPRLINGHRQD